ncbi:MAG: nucleoside deaminase [Flavobacteriaceae bacterium]|jgi:tRNA(Arg) A34 adenosine deaminase TadA|nr:nucleoside deaminase [Flavobacteriaceae bacterium]
MNTYNPAFMQRAITLSQEAYTSGKGLPIGCVIVKNNQIIGEGHNEIFMRKNPTAHGEMVAIEDACKQLNNILLEDCELYTTLEPCPMCFSAIYWAKIKCVYYACTNVDASAVGFDDSFIFEQMQKPNSEQLIPMIHFKETKAFEVLQSWKNLEQDAAQPWQDKI